jgi:hypothetical protein
MMTVADSIFLSPLDLDAFAVRSTAGKLMTVPISHSPDRTPLLGSCRRFEARKVNGPLTGGS